MLLGSAAVPLRVPGPLPTALSTTTSTADVVLEGGVPCYVGASHRFESVIWTKGTFGETLSGCSPLHTATKFSMSIYLQLRGVYAMHRPATLRSAYNICIFTLSVGCKRLRSCCSFEQPLKTNEQPHVE